MTISGAVADRVEKLLRQKGLSAYKLVQLSALPKETFKSLMKGKTASTASGRFFRCVTASVFRSESFSMIRSLITGRTT